MIPSFTIWRQYAVRILVNGIYHLYDAVFTVDPVKSLFCRISCFHDPGIECARSDSGQDHDKRQKHGKDTISKCHFLHALLFLSVNDCFRKLYINLPKLSQAAPFFIVFCYFLIFTFLTALNFPFALFPFTVL